MEQLTVVQEFQASFLRIVNKFHQLERIALDHGSGDRLYPAQTHAVEAIGRQPGVTVGKLAVILGVTKGAVSQTVSKLSRQGLVDKTRDPGDAKVIHLTLTPRGETVFAGHARFHARHDAQAAKALLALDDHDLAVLRRFLVVTENSLDAYLRDLA